MSVRPDPVIPETRRRRASTTEKSERILKMSRSLTLTRSVLAGTLAEATPNQLDFIERWFTAELDSRERSKRLRLLKQAGFPADKTLDGYDWTTKNRVIQIHPLTKVLILTAKWKRQSSA